MAIKLQKPSVLAIRSSLILEGIRKSFSQSVPTNIFATGRTNVGKTTLGNRLIGEEYFTVTGRQNTTNEINLIEFPNGLKYFDLPGVDSDDRLENYNRASLGLSQISGFPQVDKVTLTKFRSGNEPNRRNLTVNSYKELNLRPDLVFYIVAPHKQISRGESAYLWDLLETYQNVIYVLNFFVDKKTNKRLVNSNNIENVETVIKQTHADVLGAKSLPIIVRVNCLTGEGVANLLLASEKILGEEKGKAFSGLISYQQERTPKEYVYQVEKELIKVFAYVACQKPDSESIVGQPLDEACQVIWNFLGDLVKLQHKGLLRNIWEKLTGKIIDVESKNVGEIFKFPTELVSYIVRDAVEKCSQHHYEDVYREVKKSKPIYKQVARFRTVPRQVDDYDRPRQEQRYGYRNPDDIFQGIGNFFKHDRWKTKYYYYVTVGYEKKTVYDEVFDHYDDVFSHTETWTEQEKTGQKKLVRTTYNHFGKEAIYTLIAFVQLMVIGKFSRDDYQISYGAIVERTSQLYSFPSSTNQDKIVRFLEDNLKLFDENFTLLPDMLKKNLS